MSKHIPERTCIVCRKKADKNNFLKLVKNAGGKISIERETKLEGRGAYICKNEQCILKARKTKALSRAFKTNVSEELYEELENESFK